MGFNETDVYAVTLTDFGDRIFLAWKAVSGTVFQIYYGQQLAWAGTALSTWLSAPTEDVRVYIGSVDPADEYTDFGATLAAPARRVQLTWQAGTSTAPDLDHFAVFGEATPGGGIDYTTPLATISAFGGGDPVALGSYSWTSGALYSGTWSFCVVGYDIAGNEGTRETRSAVVAVPPGPPAKFDDGTRLHYTFHANGLTPSVSLAWNAVEYP